MLSSSERVSIGTIALEVGGLGETVTVEATRLAREHRRNAARRRHHADADRADPGARPRRDVAHAAAARRPLHHAGRLAWAAAFGVDVPNVGGLPADWSKVIIDGVVANEVGNSGMKAQKVNLDAIAEVRAAEQLVSRRVRPVGRLAGADRHPRRHARSIAASATTTAVTSVQQHRVLPRTVAAAPRHRALPAQVPVQHLWRQPRRPGARRARRSCSSSTRWKRRWCSARRACRRGACRRRSSGRATSRRPSTRRAG